jgi:hypothetical protein
MVPSLHRVSRMITGCGWFNLDNKDWGQGDGAKPGQAQVQGQERRQEQGYRGGGGQKQDQQGGAGVKGCHWCL